MESFYLCNSEIFGLSNSTAVVYNFLCRVNNVTTGKSFYKRSNIAKSCHVSESTVVRSLRTLCAKGLLEIKRRFDEKGRQTSNDYILIDNPQLRISTDSSWDTPLKAGEAKKIGGGKHPRLFPLHMHTGTGELSPNAMKVYSYLSFRAGATGQCMPSKKEISNDCSISMTTVWRALHELRNTGCVEVRRQTRLTTCGNNGTSVNLYIIRVISGAADVPGGDANINVHALSADFASLRKNCDVTDVSSIKRRLSLSRHESQPNYRHLLASFTLHDTLPDFTGDTPRTKSRIKVTINPRVKRLLSSLTDFFSKALTRFERNRISPAKID